LERENSQLRQRAETAEKAAIKLVEAEKDVAQLRSQKVKLEKLCRGLQAQRVEEVSCLERRLMTEAGTCDRLMPGPDKAFPPPS